MTAGEFGTNIQVYSLLTALLVIGLGCGDSESDTTNVCRQGYESTGGKCVPKLGAPSEADNELGNGGQSNNSTSRSDASGDVPYWLVGNWQYHWGQAYYESDRETNRRYFEGMEGGTRSWFLNSDGTFQLEAMGNLKVIYDDCYLLTYQGTYDVKGPVQCNNAPQGKKCFEVTLRGKKYTQTQQCDGTPFTPDTPPPTRSFQVQLLPEMYAKFHYEQSDDTWTSRKYEKMKMDCLDLLTCWQTCRDTTKTVNEGAGGHCSCQFPARSSLEARQGIHAIKDCAVDAGCPAGSASKECKDQGYGRFCTYDANILDQAASQQTTQCVKQNCDSQIRRCENN